MSPDLGSALELSPPRGFTREAEPARAVANPATKALALSSRPLSTKLSMASPLSVVACPGSACLPKLCARSLRSPYAGRADGPALTPLLRPSWHPPVAQLKWVIPFLLQVLSAACTSSTPSVASSPTPSAEASDAVPILDELIGDWESRKGTQTVLLTLRENGSYRVKRGLAQGMGTWRAASASQLDFLAGDPCPGRRGSYEWTIEGGR
jgi:hypothetical protein